MGVDKDKMIDKLIEAKDLVIEVHNVTYLPEVGDIMCSIDEAIAIIEDIPDEAP